MKSTERRRKQMPAAPEMESLRGLTSPPVDDPPDQQDSAWQFTAAPVLAALDSHAVSSGLSERHGLAVHGPHRSDPNASKVEPP